MNHQPDVCPSCGSEFTNWVNEQTTCDDEDFPSYRAWIEFYKCLDCSYEWSQEFELD